MGYLLFKYQVAITGSCKRFMLSRISISICITNWSVILIQSQDNDLVYNFYICSFCIQHRVIVGLWHNNGDPVFPDIWTPVSVPGEQDLIADLVDHQSMSISPKVTWNKVKIQMMHIWFAKPLSTRVVMGTLIYLIFDNVVPAKIRSLIEKM